MKKNRPKTKSDKQALKSELECMSSKDKDMPHLFDFVVHGGGNDGDVAVDDARIADSTGIDFDD